ncbi:hypothetical protein Tbd_0513 [Thiobacillus denitrificans ATCC 25259]|uniref:Ice-binding protein C-terminal domain-containing protein n=1 Tax=Thiobacillus denitrificans (strain ATCC 25259 / T1) TaxID=292415 RepID=Q3SLE7_THIDA|nr:PEP-CTERM sorting domain-containing protein [Thiobacillus denitrificans]AAZ96466.1 hypothetical protein Tbd_0513 [Thiobacillus denitrificans ATCC 25259]
MRAFPIAYVLFLSTSAFPLAAQAVAVSELPASIQSCITSGSCVVNYPGAYDSGTASAFEMFDLSSQKWNWLVRYNLVPPSGQTVIGGGPNTAYSGYLWMQVASSYSASEAAHPVTVFLDKVTPAPDSMFDQSGDLSLLVTTADLLAGGAYSTLEDHGEYGYFGSGSLSGELPLICLAEGCKIEARLNLLQLNYANAGSTIVMTGFDASDMRGLVYSQGSYYFDGEPPYGTKQAFYIAAVPEPGMAWLFGFGLLGVGAVARSRRTGL